MSRNDAGMRAGRWITALAVAAGAMICGAPVARAADTQEALARIHPQRGTFQVNPDEITMQVSIVDITDEPFEEGAVRIAVTPADLSVMVESIPADAQFGDQTVTVSMAVAPYYVRNADEVAVSMGRFTLRLDAEGQVVGVEPPSLVVFGEAAELLQSGLFTLVTDVEADFWGRVTLSQVHVLFGGSDGQIPAGGNDNSGNDNGGNTNDNAGNTNDNAGNTNDNAGNTNDNAGNTNDNAGNTNDNGGNTNDNGGNTNDNSGNTNGNDNGNGNLAIIGSLPPTGAIDARQPFEPDGSNPDGITEVRLDFNGDTSGLTPSDFDVVSTGGVTPTPVVVNVTSIGTSLLVDLSTFIVLEGWTDIIHLDSGSCVRLGYLPADVNNDGTSSAGDVLALIDGLNGITTLAEYQSDIDRSGVAGPPDILRVIDLLNGAAAYDVYNLFSLPAAGAPCDLGNGNGNDNGNTNGNDNGGNTNGNDNGGNTNGNDNGGNTNGNDNGGNTNGNDNGGNTNGNDNGGNTNGNDNGGNTNGNDNGGNTNGNDNGGNTNGNDNGGNTNGNDNGGNTNGNANGNTNGNANGNTNGNGNGNDNGSVCPDGDVRLTANLSGQGSGTAQYRLEDDRERFEIEISGAPAGTYPIIVKGVTVGSISIGGNGQGGVDFDTNDGNFPGNFPTVFAGDVVQIGGILSGTFFLDCS